MLRPYQQEAVDVLFGYWEKNNKPCVIQAATGFGKSHLIAEIVKRVQAPTLVLQPTKEILEQNHEKLLLAGLQPSQIQICSASAGSWRIGGLTLATIGTIYKNASLCGHFKYIIIDECDVVPCDKADSMYMKFLNELPNARIVGLTATPWRNQVFARLYDTPNIVCRPVTRIHCNGGKGTHLGEWVWGRVIYRCGIKALQNMGFLSPTKYFEAETDWSFVKDSPGRSEYEMEQMSQWMDIDENLSRFHQAIVWCMKNHLKTIVFTPNINMNFELAAHIRALGGTAATMDSNNDSKKSREAKMRDFRAGKFQFLVNVGMVGRGVDVPSVDAVVLCRPTKSLSLYIQAVGRCLRLDPERPDKTAYILDLAGCMKRFGKAEDVELVRIDKVTEKGWQYKQEAIRIIKNGKPKLWDKVT